MTTTPIEPDQTPDETPDETPGGAPVPETPDRPEQPVGPGEDPVVLPEEEQPEIQPI